MTLLRNFFGSSVGRKFLMAGSGGVLLLFVIGHMIGNLQIFLPPEAINRYARFLQSLGELLWGVRLFLLAMLVLHVWSAVSLSIENRNARPEPYAGGHAPFAASLASRTMLVTGIVVATFLAYHLLHFTAVVDGINGARVSLRALKEQHDVYAVMIAGFSVWYVSLFYLVGVGLLCFHLSHGIAAMFQSLGLKNAAYAPLVEKLSKSLALALFLGYASIPTAVLVFGHGKAHLNAAIDAAATHAVAAQTGKDLVK